MHRGWWHPDWVGKRHGPWGQEVALPTSDVLHPHPSAALASLPLPSPFHPQSPLVPGMVPRVTPNLQGMEVLGSPTLQRGDTTLAMPLRCHFHGHRLRACPGSTRDGWLGCAFPRGGLSPSDRDLFSLGVTQRSLGQLSAWRPVAIRLHYRKGEQFIGTVIRRPPHPKHTAGTLAELLALLGSATPPDLPTEKISLKSVISFKKPLPFSHP